MRVGVLVLANAHHQKDRRPRKRTDHSLRKNDLVEFVGCVHYLNPRCPRLPDASRVIESAGRSIFRGN